MSTMTLTPPSRAEQPQGSRPTAPPPTSEDRMNESIRRLRDGADAFVRLSLAERAHLARTMQAGYLGIAERSVRAGCAAKGLTWGTPAVAEEWATGPWCVVRHLRLVAEALDALARTGNTPIGPVRRTADGRLAVQLFPGHTVDRMLFAGIAAEVQFPQDVTESVMRESSALYYRTPTREGRVVLVLGAGNLAAIPAMDVITKLFNEGKTCLLKMNPVNAYLGPFYEEAFAEPIRRGFLAITYGGAEQGAYLARHPGVDEIHLTGSDHTYDMLVWGPAGPERERRKATNAPLITKPVTAELGNVTPVLVVPGPYSDREMGFQAESIAGAVACNASFNCNSPKMLVTAKGWSGRSPLLGGIERVLSTVPPRDAYYPGAEQRWRELTQNRPAMRTAGAPAAGQLPWTLLPGLDAASLREPAFTTEPFCSILSETEVGSDDPVEFLDRAVEFANNRLWGTLSAEIVVHPRSLRDPKVAAAFERAIARLRYGVVAVNCWSGFLFAFGSPPWGAYPGSAPADIQSGTGSVHNTSMLEGFEKAVLRHPVTIMPKPATFPSHRTAHRLMPKLVRLEERSGWRHVPGVVAEAMRG